MDITLIKTFLEVASTGSFVSAADNLFVTQSAVSLRIQRLEGQLGQTLFNRSKAGATLTFAGAEFEGFAIRLVKLWEEARQQVAVPEGFERTLAIGAQYSLWSRMGYRWLDRIQQLAPKLSLRAEVGMPDRLTRFMGDGVIQCCLTYSPNLRPGLVAERVMQDELVLAASWPDPDWPIDGDYIFVDWGPEFTRAHAISLPELQHRGLTLALGSLAADYVVNRRASAYLPARSIQRQLDAGELHLVPNAPRFPFPIWAVWRDDMDPILRATARTALTEITAGLDMVQGNILRQLAEISEGAATTILGENSGADT